MPKVLVINAQQLRLRELMMALDSHQKVEVLPHPERPPALRDLEELLRRER